MSLEERVQRLERQNRTLKCLAAAGVISIAGVAIGGAEPAQPTAGRIQAKEFVLVDDAGKERGALRMVEQKFGSVIHRGPYLVLSDSAGTHRLELGSREGNNSTNQVEMNAYTKAGKDQIGFVASSEDSGRASFYLQHDSGTRVDIGADVKLADVVVSSQSTVPAPQVKIFAMKEVRGLVIREGKELTPTMVDESQEIRITHEDGKNKITIFDKDGKPAWSQP